MTPRARTGEIAIIPAGDPGPVCPARTADGGVYDLAWMALSNGLAFCESDAELDAYQAKMEPIRLALWPDFDPTVTR